MRERRSFLSLVFAAALLAQLKPGGWFLGPVGQGASQRMTKIRRTGEGFEALTLAPVLFVPIRRRSVGRE